MASGLHDVESDRQSAEDKRGEHGRGLRRRTFLAMVPLSYLAVEALPTAVARADSASVLNIVAHQDDDLLFLSPDLLNSVLGGATVRTVYLTAGDAGMTSAYWRSREAGVKAAYAEVAGVANSWTQSDAGVAGFPIPVFTLAGTSVSLAFLRLPDGNVSGSGFASTGFESLMELWNGTISSITTVDSTSTYTLATLTSTLAGLMTSFAPTQVNTLDFLGTYGDGDHSDHHTAAYLAKSAVLQYNSSIGFAGYEGYPISSLPANVAAADLATKQNAFFTYAVYDNQTCSSFAACAATNYDGWLARQYTVYAARPPVASPGAVQAVLPGATVTLDGSGTTDPFGNAVTYQWTQTSGTAVTLSSATAVKPTFTAPASVGALVFQLVATDTLTQVSSVAASTQVLVTNTPANIAANATATASSVASGQPASAAIDGVVSGYPVNAGAEWSSNGGGAGSWLQLTWGAMQTADTVVLYDRPNLNDQITGGNITFSDGSAFQVGALPNNGAPYVLTFTAKAVTSIRLNITSVSATTSNVGLAEMQVFDTGFGGGTSGPPTASAGTAQTVASGSTVTLDGSGSADPGGYQLAYEWTQTAGPAVALSSTAVVQPTFTAPVATGQLTFQLVVTDSLGNVSSPATVTVTVAAANLALSATATASSAASGQPASAAIDGVIAGYPANSAAEWSTNYGKAGSWLQLTWPTAQTFDTVVLYDRPNLIDQITGGNITFSDGSSVVVGSLPNNGAAYQLNFAAKTVTSLRLNVTSVSATTQSCGLAEIQVYNGSGTAPNYGPPVASAGAAQHVSFGTTVTLDASGSTDPGGLALTYQWTQTAGTHTVTLSSATAVQPTFTAPSTADSLTFQVIVTDSQGNVSSPATVTVTVMPANLALSATATASSAASGQPASAAIDGVIAGYPANSAAEWSTNYGKAGSWLQLTWPTAQTFDTVVLYDRPNLIDQITGGNITFSDGSSVAVGTLPNDGSADTVSFAAKTTTTLRLNITSVSSSTQNVGLAEIQVFRTGSGSGGSPVANAGTAQTVNAGAAVTLNGSSSTDPGGYSLSYQWAQTDGTTVALSSTTAVQPTFTAPATAGTLTFQLIVTDTQGSSSVPATVTITVNQTTTTTTNLALSATATASSQNTSTGQTAAKAIDGVISGYPANSAAEWATTSGKAGSWLQLTWPTAQTIDTIVLYDRPNLSDQITGGTITFSDGTSVAVGTLPNNGAAYTLTFPAKTVTSLKLTIISVSSTTQNVGLAEIQVFDA